MKRVALLLVLLAAIFIPGAALAQAVAGGDDSVLVSVERDVVIAAGDRVGTLVVVSGNAVVSGHAQTVVVVDGTLTVDGTVEETIVAVDSDVTLHAAAVVGGDVVLAGGELTREQGATIDGSVTRDYDFRFGWALTLISILFWIGITIGLMITGLVLVAIARRQVRGVGDLLTNEPGPAILATVILVIGLPVIAVAAIVTILGIPVGLAILLIVLPVLWVAGYVAASERLGRTVLGANRGAGAAVSPYLAVLLGLAIFQVAGLVPVLGSLMVGLAATYGAGGLVLYAWRAWRGSMTPVAPAA